MKQSVVTSMNDSSCNKKNRAQLAVESMISYSWGVIAVLLIVGILYLTGVFNPSTASNSCILSDQLACAEFGIDLGGNLHLDIGQATGRRITVTGLGCGSSANPAITNLGSPVIIDNNKHSFITPSGGIHCDNAGGEAFSGTILINYTVADLPFPKTAKGAISARLAPVNNTGGAPTALPTPSNQISQGNVPYVINSPGTYYLTGNVSCNRTGTQACILVNSSNVVLECQSFSITSPCCGGVWDCNCGIGVYLYNVTNVQVHDCKTTGFVTGVQADYTNWSTVSGGYYYDNGYHGMDINYGGNITFTNNNMSGNLDHGISLYLTMNNMISFNNISSSQYRGISVWNASVNTLLNNTVPNDNYFGIELTDGCWNTTLINNTACGSSPDLQCYDSSYSILNASGNICASENCANLSCSAGC